MGRAVKKVSPLDVFMAAIGNCLATWGAAARAVPCPAVDNGSCMKKIGNPNHKYGRKSGGSSIISAVCEVLMSLTPPQSMRCSMSTSRSGACISQNAPTPGPSHSFDTRQVLIAADDKRRLASQAVSSSMLRRLKEFIVPGSGLYTPEIRKLQHHVQQSRYTESGKAWARFLRFQS